MFGVDLCHHWKVVRRESSSRRRMDSDPSKCTSGVYPDAIQCNNWPGYRKRCGAWRPPQATIEHVRRRPSREPIIEVAKHDNQRIANRIEIVEDLPHLKSSFVNAKAKVCREYMQQRAADIYRRGQRAARFAVVHRQIDATDLHDGMTCEQRVAEAFGLGLSRPLPCRAQGTLVAIERREDDGRARFHCNAGWIGELLQRDDVRVQFPDHRRHAIRIVPSVPPHTRVYVVGRDPKRCQRGH
jgi:hypothetical protein